MVELETHLGADKTCGQRSGRGELLFSRNCRKLDVDGAERILTKTFTEWQGWVGALGTPPEALSIQSLTHVSKGMVTNEQWHFHLVSGLQWRLIYYLTVARSGDTQVSLRD